MTLVKDEIKRKFGYLPSLPRIKGWMLGLILGRNCGLGWVELKPCRFLPNEAAFDGSDFLGVSPLGDGMAIVRGLGAIELGRRSAVADLGSKDGVVLAGVAGLVASV